MTLIHRGAGRGKEADRESRRYSEKFSLMTRNRERLRIVAVGAVVLMLFSVPLFRGEQGNLKMAGIGEKNTLAHSEFLMEDGVRLVLNFQDCRQEDSTVSMGPHDATLYLGKECPEPGLYLRLEGDALDTVEMKEIDKGKWQGQFSFPISGSYTFIAYWIGCDGKQNEKKVLIPNLNVRLGAKNRQGADPGALCPPAVWISSKKFSTEVQLGSQQYILHTPYIPPSDAELLKTSDSVVAKASATFPESGTYDFSKLSNYELVCWIGSDSAETIRGAFLKLRTIIHQGQRPFKFHYYPSRSFLHPDAAWEETTKQRFRKCKHILVSMDQLDKQLTQEEYLKQLRNFITHLTLAFPDETFPIWIFSTMESPMKPTNCIPTSLPRSTDHPCNNALKALFSEIPVSSRARFLDATTITLPQLGENPEDVATAIALRIYTFVGKQVQEWRAQRQIGNIHGLQRGEVLEPNFELIPYNDWGT